MITTGLGNPVKDRFNRQFGVSKSFIPTNAYRPRFGSSPDGPGAPDSFTKAAGKNAESQLPQTPQSFFEQLELMRQLDAPQRKQVFEDLRTLHIGFWRNQMENSARLTARMGNFVARLPLHLVRVVNRDYGKQLVQRSKENGARRENVIVSPFRRYSDPSVLEARIDETPFVKKLRTGLKTFGSNGEISLQAFEALFERVTKQPQSFKTSDELETAKTLVASFPILVQRSDKADTLTDKALNTFVQNVKDSVPFFYDRYGQDAAKYVDVNLYYLGAQSALPELSTLKRTKEKVSARLNEYPTYRKVARWAKENQLSDTQFLPIYSAADAIYGQSTAYISGLGDRPTLAATVSQMIALDGVFNMIGFFTTKLQILLVGWEKEKPDKQRALFEKEIKQLNRKQQQLKEKLELEQKKLAEAIQANPANEKALTENFQKTVLNPMTEETKQLVGNVEQFQIKLDKLLGIREMGFFEKAWKKPPKLLNDLKYMVPISLALTIPYEYFYINRYTNYDLDLISWKSVQLFSFFTGLSVVSNTIMKQIIHLTQDTAKLYQHGKKDELMAENTRDFLSNLKGFSDLFSKSENPKVKELGQELEKYYKQIAVPLIGDESEQSGTEKALNREAKLDFSSDKTYAVKILLKSLDADIKQAGTNESRKAMKKFRKYLTLLNKVEDRVAYIQINRSKFDLQTLGDQYRIEIGETELGKHLPEKYKSFFTDTVQESVDFLTELEKKYPKAELTYEPLLLKAKEDHDKIQSVLETALKAGSLDAGMETGLLGWMRRNKDRGEQGNSRLNTLLREMGKAASTPEEKDAAKRSIKAIQRTQKGLRKSLYYLNAKNREEALKDMEDYRQARKDYAAETRQMPFGTEKMRRKFTQVGMAFKQAGKKLSFIDKYNFWSSGIKWVPAHSGLNVTGRIGFVSIVQGHWIDPLVMLKIWALAQVPLRFWIFGVEKFMLARDAFHRTHAEAEKKMAHGIPHYLKTLISEKQGTAKATGVKADSTPPAPADAKVSELPTPEAKTDPDKKSA